MSRERRSQDVVRISKELLGRTLWVQVERPLQGYVQVRLPDGQPGVIQRREMSLERDRDPRTLVRPGQRILAQVIGVTESGRSVALSHRQTLADPWDAFVQRHREGDVVHGWVKDIEPRQGVYVEILPGVDGLIPRRELAPWPVARPEDVLRVGDSVEVVITAIRPTIRQVDLSLRERVLRDHRTRRLAWELGVQEDGRGLFCHRVRRRPSALPRLLLLEDRTDLALSFARRAQAQGWEVRLSVSLAEARDLLPDSGPCPFDAVLVDVGLPDGSGLHFVEQLRERWPEIPAAVTSTEGRLASIEPRLQALGVDRFPKPWDPQELQAWLDSIRAEEREDSRVARSPRARDVRVQEPLSPLQMPSETSELENVQQILEVTCRAVKADAGLVARLLPAQDRVELIASWGRVSRKAAPCHFLADSPVGDVIREGRLLFERQATRGHRRNYFANLLRCLPFESCIGLPVHGTYRPVHALFVFHRDAGRFSRRHLRRLLAQATVLAGVLDREAFSRLLEANSQVMLAGWLASAAAHEMANAVNAMDVALANLEPLLQSRDAVDEDIQAEVQVLQHNVQTLRHLLDGFGGLASQRQERPVALHELLGRLQRVLRPLAAREQVRLEFVLDPALSRWQVRGSATAVCQIVLNLALNAVQHMADLPPVEEWRGLLYVRAALVDGDPGPHVLIQVEDTGPGVHAEHRDRIFEAGFTTRPGGSGLGLAIARSLAASLGGRVWLEESMPLVRTVFQVTLPLEPMAAFLEDPEELEGEP